MISSRIILACLIFIGSIKNNALCTEDQCHEDCIAPQYIRPIGPTRPHDNTDPLGNRLLLTRPYPYAKGSLAYAHENKAISAFVFNTTLWLDVRGEINEWEYGHFERYCVSYALRKILSRFSFHKIKFLFESDSLILDRENYLNDELGMYLTFETEVRESVADEIEEIQIDLFFEKNIAGYIQKMTTTGNFTDMLYECGSRVSSKNFENPKLRFSLQASNITNEQFVHKLVLSPSQPNNYSKACQLGCTFFFSLEEHPKKLSSCFLRCEDRYAYNVSVGYNDLMELVRLECRDGCITAIMRCQPGYFCIQPSNVTAKQSRDGSNVSMRECPPGTYRDISYDAVDACVPCPPGRYREATRGDSLESCAKCPVGTAVNSTGNTSIRDCKRCPAGRFTAEKGRDVCKCITPQACAEEQLEDPADAEKRNTVPFIGRW